MLMFQASIRHGIKLTAEPIKPIAAVMLVG